MRRILAAATLLLAGAALLRTLPALGQAIPDKAPVDLNDPAIIKEGEELYMQTKDGQGGRGPTLRGRGFDFRHEFDRITTATRRCPRSTASIRPSRSGRSWRSSSR